MTRLYADASDSVERAVVALADGQKEWEARGKAMRRRVSHARGELDRLRQYAKTIGLDATAIAARARDQLSDPAGPWGERPASRGTSAFTPPAVAAVAAVAATDEELQ